MDQTLKEIFSKKHVEFNQVIGTFRALGAYPSVVDRKVGILGEIMCTNFDAFLGVVELIYEEMDIIQKELTQLRGKVDEKIESEIVARMDELKAHLGKVISEKQYLVPEEPKEPSVRGH